MAWVQVDCKGPQEIWAAAHDVLNDSWPKHWRRKDPHLSQPPEPSTVRNVLVGIVHVIPIS